MSKATKRKYVASEILNEFVLPKETQQIVKVSASRGNNLHLVEGANGEEFLASMPTKFRKNIWIKRGDFVIVEPIEEGDKVKAEIVYILYKHNIKYIQQEGCWPQAFKKKEVEEDSPSRENSDEEEELDDEDSESENDDRDLFVNPNRHNPTVFIESSEDSSSEEDK